MYVEIKYNYSHKLKLLKVFLYYIYLQLQYIFESNCFQFVTNLKNFEFRINLLTKLFPILSTL